MNTRLIVLASFLAALAAVTHVQADGDIDVSFDHGEKTIGSGTQKSETRALSGFDTVVMKGPTDVELSIGPSYAVTVTADDNILPLIGTDVDGSTLIINTKHSYHTRHSPKVTLQLPLLKALSIHGSGDALLSGLSGDKLQLAISGSGDIEASGSVNALDVEIDGSGDVKADKLAAKSTRVRINGSGDANIAADEALDVVINGSGDVRYHGNPTHLAKAVHGSGDVEKD